MPRKASQPARTQGAEPSAVLETKSDGGSQLVVLDKINQVARLFEEFKEANDRRLDEIEAKGAADPLSEVTIDRVSAEIDALQDQLDDLQIKSSRPGYDPDDLDDDYGFDDGDDYGDGEKSMPWESLEYKGAFNSWLRTGDPSQIRSAVAGMNLEGKDLSSLVQTDGGYLVQSEMANEILDLVRETTPMRQYARVMETSASSLEFPVNVLGATTKRAGEKQERTKTDTSEIELVKVDMHEIYAEPRATQTILEDAAIDLESWLAQETAAQMAQDEGYAFIWGDGKSQPIGLLSTAVVANASWAWGKLGFVASGAAGALPSDSAGDELDPLLDLCEGALKARYRQNAHWMMNRATRTTLRKIKDADGNMIWRPSLEVGKPAELLGYPIIEAEDMPNIAANSFSIAFGDFNRGYLIVDKANSLITLRDDLTSKPYVKFYTRKRYGGRVLDYDAIKLMKFAE